MKKLYFVLLLCTVFMFSASVVCAENIENSRYEIEVVLNAQYEKIHLDETFIYAMSQMENEEYQYDEYTVTIFDYEMNQIVPPIYKVKYSSYNSDLSYFKEDRMRVQKDSKFGYIDTTGRLVIDTVYDSAGDFKNGIALVKKDGLWGVIDNCGTVVVDFLYSYIDDFSEGKAIAQKDGVMGVLDMQGNFLELPYGYLSSIRNGYIFAGLNDVKGNSYGNRIKLSPILLSYSESEFIAGDFGFIDTEGKVIYPFVLQADQNTDLIAISMSGEKYQTFFDASCFTEEGIAFVKQDSKGKYGLINRAGELLYDFVIDKYETYPNYYIGKEGDQWIFFDKQGHEIRRIGEYRNMQLYEYNPDYFIVQKSYEERGIVSSLDGSVILPPEYCQIYAINDGAAIVKRTYKENNYQLIDIHTQEILLEGVVSPINERFVYFYNKNDKSKYLTDWKGNIISQINWMPSDKYNLPSTIIDRGNYTEIVVRDDSDSFSKVRGVIDRYGNIIIEPKYKHINDSYYSNFDLPLIEAKNHSTFSVNNKDKTAKTEYFDYNGKLVYYCVGDTTYNADGIKLYDFPIILNYYNTKSYHGICVFKNQKRTGLVQIKQTKPMVKESDKTLCQTN